MPAAFLLALGLPGRLPDIMEEGRAVRGPSGALSDAREEIWECTKPAPRSLLYSNASATKKGTCGVTVRSKNHPDDCTGDKGSWELNVASEHGAASECAALCSRCSNCNFFSFSTQEKDCSWFASCDIGALRTHIGFFNATVFSTARMNDWRAAAAVVSLREAAGATSADREDDHSWRQVLRDHRKTLRRDSDSAFVQVSMNDMNTLHHVVKRVGARITGETGFASGVSSLAIVTALAKGGAHVAIDPFQGAYHYDGLRAVRSYIESAPERRLSFQHVNETASMAVAYLHTQRMCFDAFFIDDGHKFDDALVELFHAHKMLALGGALMLHDNWMPAIKKLESFIIRATWATCTACPTHSVTPAASRSIQSLTSTGAHGTTTRFSGDLHAMQLQARDDLELFRHHGWPAKALRGCNTIEARAVEHGIGRTCTAYRYHLSCSGNPPAPAPRLVRH